MKAPSLLVLVLTLALCSPSWAADKDRYDPGEEVPTFRLKALNPDAAKVKMFGLEDVVGPEATDRKKAVLLSFFATYCEPCKREMPFLEELHRTYKDKGLQIVSISIDKDEEEIKKVSGLVEKNQLDYPVLSDRFQVVAKRYFISKLPCLYMLDGDQKVTKVSIGYDDNASNELLADVRKALAIPDSEPVPPALAKFLKPSANAAHPAVPNVENSKTGKKKKSKGKKS